MYELNFTNPGEIRMGSPFNIADVDLTGGFIPDFKGYEFQDRGCVNDSGNKVVLVQWAIEKNEPGFIVWLISESDKEISKTERFVGCCQSIRFLKNEQVEIDIVDIIGLSKVEVLSFE